MKKVKINLLAIIGLMVAVGTVAFTAPKENDALALQWYTVEEPDENGNRDLEPINGNPTGDCEIDLEANICAVELDMTSPPEHFEDLAPGDIKRSAGRL